MGAILDPSGEDADDALVPARVIQADARALAHRELCHQLIGLRLHVAFDRAARAIEIVQLPGDLEGAPAILRYQALDPQAHVGQTPGGVQPRPEQKSEIESARARGIVAGNGKERAHAFLHAARADAPQALGNQDAIVEIERHDVGDRAQGDQIEHIAQIRFRLAREPSTLAQLGAQGKHHVEHHADAREALARKRAAGLVGIDDGRCARELRTRQMVVGDDHGFRLRRERDDLRGQPVAELEAVGDEKADVRAEGRKRAHAHRAGGRAVAIVIGDYQHALARGDRIGKERGRSVRVQQI